MAFFYSRAGTSHELALLQRASGICDPTQTCLCLQAGKGFLFRLDGLVFERMTQVANTGLEPVSLRCALLCHLWPARIIAVR